MIAAGDVISYLQMCEEERASLQRGMNYRLGGRVSVILMSLRRGAPYVDRIEENGKILIYEGHDVPRTKGGPDPKAVDQQRAMPNGTLTQNGLFYDAAMRFKNGESAAELVKVCEKIRTGIWAFGGLFKLCDAWQEVSGGREVFKFKLAVTTETSFAKATSDPDLPQNRLIPTNVKLEVWKRDGGKCVKCGSHDNLHFDHVIPYSLGGS